MADNVSFSSLFRRGKYSRPDVQESDEDGNNRKRIEEFSVAAVAFAMKHEAEFRRHFLEKICEVTTPFNPDEYEILLQPHDFDMVLHSETKSEFIVIEFKVWAPLDTHQKYDNEQTFTGINTNGKKGYGRQILFYGKGHSSLKYVVLAQNDSHDKLPRKNIPVGGILIKCHSCAWQDLPEQGKISKDLLDSLGSYIPELKIRQYFKMKKSKFVADATESYNLLRNVWKQITDCEPEFAIDQDESGWWFGVHMKQKGAGFAGMPKAEPGKPFGWYGYEKPIQEQNRLSIWLYCQNEQERTRLSSIIENQLGQKPIIRNKSDLIIVCDEQKSVGDAEWLLSVIQKLIKIPPVE
jgi:hypothetical protein